MFNEGFVAVGSEPNHLFRGLGSLWMAQDSRRHHLEVWGQVSITCASSHWMGCPVELECSVRAEGFISHMGDKTLIVID